MLSEKKFCIESLIFTLEHFDELLYIELINQQKLIDKASFFMVYYRFYKDIVQYFV